MRITLIAFLILILCGSVYAGPRMVLAESVFITAGPEKTETIWNTRFGLSQEIPGFSDSKSVVYSITLAKYGEGGFLKGGDQEFAFFPVRPTGKGLRIFFIAGANVTILDEEDPVTYFQFTSGMGVYWEFSPQTAFWLAFKLEESEQLTTTHVGVGLATGIF